MQVPKLLKDESAASFRARVKAWENYTGKKYPTTIKMKGTVEQQILQGNPLDTPYFSSLNIPRDYSKDIINKDGSFTAEHLKSLQTEQFDRNKKVILPPLTPQEERNLADQKNELFLNQLHKNYKRQQLLESKTPKQGQGTVEQKKSKVTSGQQNPLTIRDGEIDYNTKGETAPQGVPGQAKYGWSDVFTINPETGEALGVMGKKQRKAFEKKYWNDKRIDKSKKRTYNPNKSTGGKAYTRYG